MIRIYERSLCQSYASAYPSDSAERRFFMLVEQALGAHQ